VNSIKYSIQGPYHQESVIYNKDSGVVQRVSRANKDYYIRLQDSANGSGYEIEWDTAQGFGVHYIPEAVFYDLPALMHIFNHAKGFMIFEPVNIYAEQSIATLFNNDNT